MFGETLALQRQAGGKLAGELDPTLRVRQEPVRVVRLADFGPRPEDVSATLAGLLCLLEARPDGRVDG